MGAGIQRSLSPAMREEEARRHALQLRYWLVDLQQEGLAVDALPKLPERAQGFAGVNTTHPRKQAALACVDELSDTGQAAGAFELFTGIEPEAQRMYAHLRKLLRARGA